MEEHTTPKAAVRNPGIDRRRESESIERIGRGLTSAADLMARSGHPRFPAQPAPSAAAGLQPAVELPRVASSISSRMASFLGVTSIGLDADFFTLGGSSVGAAEFLARLARELGVQLTLDEFFADARPARLAERWLRKTGALASPPAAAIAPSAAPAAPVAARALPEDAGDDLEVIQADLDLADGLPWVGAPGFETPRRIFLTGATGFLGSHLLFDLLRHSDAHVLCLVRGREDRHAEERLAEALEGFDLPWSAELKRRITVVAGDIERPLLGLERERWDALAAEVDSVVNAAAAVDFLRGYASLHHANVLGPLALARFAAAARVKPLHHVSSIAVFNEVGIRAMGEDDPVAHIDRLFAGYDKSKWAAEAALRRAREHGLVVTFHRPGGIGGHAQTGAYNPKDLSSGFMAAWTAMRAMPEFRYMNVVPVDWVSRVIAEIVLDPAAWGYSYNLVGRPLSLREVLREMTLGGMGIRVQSWDEWRRRFLERMGADPIPHLEYLVKVLQSASALKLCEATLTGPAATGERTEAFVRRRKLPRPPRFDARAQLATLDRLARDGRAKLPCREDPPYLRFEETLRGALQPVDGAAEEPCAARLDLSVASFLQLVKDRRVDVHGELQCALLHPEPLCVESGDFWVRPDDGVPERHGVAHPLLRYYLVLRTRDGQRWWLEGKKTARPARDLWRQARTLAVEAGRCGEAASLSGTLVVPANSYVPDQIDGIRVTPSAPEGERRVAKLLWLAWFGGQVGLGFLDPMLRAAAEALDVGRAAGPRGGEE